MAVRAATVDTLLDVTRTLAPDGTQMDVAEILNKDNDIIQDMPFVEGNLVTGHRTAMRTSLPSVGWRRLNEGVPRSKSTERAIDEAAALMEANSQVDRELAILSGNIAKYRVNKGRAFIEAMGQEFAETLFYGNSTVSPTEFTGLAPRFNSISGPTGEQIIDAGGTGTDNRSIWLIAWGDDKVHGIYPKGTVGGLQHFDTTSNLRVGPDGHPIGDNILDASGNPYLGYSDNWKWRCGLAVPDPRWVVRIANIDFSLLTKDRTTGADIQDLMVQALELIQGVTDRTAFYVPRAIRTMLRRQMINDKRGDLGWTEAAGKRVMSFGEAPINRVDALNVDEARVV